MFVGTLIYHLLQVAQYNVQEMYEIGAWNVTSGVKLRSVGLVLKPTISLVNHSSDPNAIRYVHNFKERN